MFARRERPGLRGQQQELGTHTPALLTEVIDLMVSPDHGGIFVDGTFGRGGHSRGILQALGPAGQLHGLDMDPHAVTVCERGVGRRGHHILQALGLLGQLRGLNMDLQAIKLRVGEAGV